MHADALLVLVAWPATAETHKSEGDWETETGRKEEREREREDVKVDGERERVSAMHRGNGKRRK